MEYIKQNIYYLNIEELKKICVHHNIIYTYYQEQDNKVIKINVLLRKGYIIQNILNFLMNKKITKKIIKECQVSIKSNNKPKLSDKIYFRQYRFHTAYKLLSPILNNEYEACVSHIMLYELWQTNKVITYKQFANYYDKHYDKYKHLDHPEWKFIDETRNGNRDQWTKKRQIIANKIMKYIL